MGDLNSKASDESYNEIVDTNKHNLSEESKRRGSSIRSTISKESYSNHNDILIMLDRLTSETEKVVIENLTKNQYALKTALLMPIEEYLDRHQDAKNLPETYCKYGPDEELYGLFIVIKRENRLVFRYLWEDQGVLWTDNHLISVVQACAKNLWIEGIGELFQYHRTQEIYISMYCNERKTLYDGLNQISDEVLQRNTSESRKFLSVMLKALCRKPYATLTFLYMFKHIHLTNTKVHTKEIDPAACSDDLFILIFKQNDIFRFAEKFDEVCNSDLEEKRRYRNIISRMIDFSFIIMPSAIPISRIWKSIKIGAEEDFQKCLSEARQSWPLVITMRKGPSTVEFKQAMQDERVKSLGVAKWKPVHLMIYFGRTAMIDKLLEFSGKSLRKALSIENKKLQTSDDFHPLKMCIRLKNPTVFDNLWNLVHLWSVMHLYQVIKELRVPTLYNEEIFKNLITAHTTKEIVVFLEGPIQKHIFSTLNKCIDENSLNKNNLKSHLKKLKKYQPKKMEQVGSPDESSSGTHSSGTYEEESSP